MRTKVRVAAGIAVAALLVTGTTGCDDDDITGPGQPTFTATLIGAAEVPPTTSTATGTAEFFDRGTSIDYVLTVSPMTAVTAAHIHQGPATCACPVIINLFIPNVATGNVSGVIATGTITPALNRNISLDSLRTLINNQQAYVNVHTTVNPGGDIRGTIVRN